MRILLLGKDRELGELRRMILESSGHSTTFPASRQEAFAAAEESGYDLVLICHSLSRATAIELTRKVRERCPGCPIVIVTRTLWGERKIPRDATVPYGDPQTLVSVVEEMGRKRGGAGAAKRRGASPSPKRKAKTPA